MTKVAAVILADSGAEAERQARTALGKGADLVELRLDHIRDLNPGVVRKLASAVGSRAIATLRSPAQGGAHGLERSRRSSLLKDICSQRFGYVDLELETDAGEAQTLVTVARRHRVHVIVSHHFLKPADLSEVEDALDACARIGDVAKVALPAIDVDTAMELVELARTQGSGKRRVVLIGMGPEGMITRALAEDVGQEIQYAAWGRAAAPGQLPLATAVRLRTHEPVVLGLVGHPIGHSISPAIQEAALAALGLPAVYLPFDVGTESLDGLLHAAHRLHLRGFNVTIPHKETMAHKLDELDGDAQRLGAVNTVVIEEGWTKGHNTDVFGFRISLRSLGLRVGDRRVLVVGAGGAAKAVVHVVLREGAHVEITNRTIARSKALADAFDEPVDVIPMDSLARRGPWDLLVNATPVGTKGFANGLPVPESVVARASFVYDLVYNPPNTPLLQAAKRLNRPGTSGLEMLLQQAAKSFELWTGHSAPFEAMRRAAKEALR